MPSRKGADELFYQLSGALLRGTTSQHWPELASVFMRLLLIAWASNITSLGKTRKVRVGKVGEGSEVRKHETVAIGQSEL